MIPVQHVDIQCVKPNYLPPSYLIHLFYRCKHVMWQWRESKRTSTYSRAGPPWGWFREEYTWRTGTMLFMVRKPRSSTTFFINKSIRSACRKAKFSNKMRTKRTFKKDWIEEEHFNNSSMLVVISLDLKKLKQ